MGHEYKPKSPVEFLLTDPGVPPIFFFHFALGRIPSVAVRQQSVAVRQQCWCRFDRTSAAVLASREEKKLPTYGASLQRLIRMEALCITHVMNTIAGAFVLALTRYQTRFPRLRKTQHPIHGTTTTTDHSLPPIYDTVNPATRIRINCCVTMINPPTSTPKTHRSNHRRYTLPHVC